MPAGGPSDQLLPPRVSLLTRLLGDWALVIGSNESLYGQGRTTAVGKTECMDREAGEGARGRKVT